MHTQELQHTNARKEQELHAARCQLDDLRGRVEVCVFVGVFLCVCDMGEEETIHVA